MSEIGSLAACELPGGGFDEIFQGFKIKLSGKMPCDEAVSQGLMGGGAVKQAPGDGLPCFVDPALFKHEIAPQRDAFFEVFCFRHDENAFGIGKSAFFRLSGL